MVTRRRQLLGMLLSERQHISLATPLELPSVQAMIEVILQQIDDLKAQIAEHVKEHYDELDKLLRSTSGIGPIASATLIGELPELGKLCRREIAALCRCCSYGKGLRQFQGASTHSGWTLRDSPCAVHGHHYRI